MRERLSRRELFAGGTVLAAGGPTYWKKADVKPVVVSSANGNQFKNGGAMTRRSVSCRRGHRSGDLSEPAQIPEPVQEVQAAERIAIVTP